MIVTLVVQRRIPFLLAPWKTEPSAGPAAPFTHLPPAFSGDHSPIRGRAVTSAHTLSVGAVMSRVAAVGWVMGQTIVWSHGTNPFRHRPAGHRRAQGARPPEVRQRGGGA